MQRQKLEQQNVPINNRLLLSTLLCASHVVENASTHSWVHSVTEGS